VGGQLFFSRLSGGLTNRPPVRFIDAGAPLIFPILRSTALSVEAYHHPLAMTSTPSSQPLTPKRLAKMPANQALNVNDLLNFTLPPRQQRPFSNVPRRSRKTGTTQSVWNKERE